MELSHDGGAPAQRRFSRFQCVLYGGAGGGHGVGDDGTALRSKRLQLALRGCAGGYAFVEGHAGNAQSNALTHPHLVHLHHLAPTACHLAQLHTGLLRRGKGGGAEWQR